MRNTNSAIVAKLAERQGLDAKNLLWIVAKNRTTGEPESIGVWNGIDTQVFTIDGEARTYIGAGGVVQFGDFKQQQGLMINRLSVTINPVSPEMITAIYQYEPKMARVQVHEAFFDPQTDNLIADPELIMKGWIDTIALPTPKKNDVGTGTINLVGHTRFLTRKTAIRRSNENQNKRQSGDNMFKYVALTGTLVTPWGSASVASYPTGGGGNYGGSLTRLDLK